MNKVQLVAMAFNPALFGFEGTPPIKLSGRFQRIGNKVMPVPIIGQPSIGYRASLLSAIVESINDYWRFSMHEMGADLLPANERYGYMLRWRVCRHLERELQEIQRDMDTRGRHSRYVHWSNSLGRYYDEGE